jgi:hypothetical protein
MDQFYVKVRDNFNGPYNTVAEAIDVARKMVESGTAMTQVLQVITTFEREVAVTVRERRPSDPTR